jgi:prepilin-type N-terminal cleavage/methylation domain-containing protein
MAKILKAFTLIEVLIVVALIATISAIALPYTLQQLQANAIENTAKELSSLVYSTQQEAYNGKDNKPFGIKFNTTNYIYFRGANFAAAEVSDTFTLPANVSINNISLNGGATEIVFNSGSLIPSAYGSIRLSGTGASYLMTINQQGLISFAKV